MKEKFLVSGYTKRTAKGIYSVILDTDKNQLESLQEIAQVQGPTYLTLDSKNHLYACASDENGGGIAAFQYNGETADYLNAVTVEGASLCYVAVDEKRQVVYGTNYHLGQVRVYTILKDGSLELVDQIQHADHHGPKPEQNAPHCHYSDLTPDDRLAVCDLGNDEVYTYNIADNGMLTEHAVYKTAPGRGPRHITFHPSGQIAYLADELGSKVEVLTYENGEFTHLHTLTTLPDSHEGFNGVAAIRLSSDGNFLYVSNRGNDSIVIYAVSPDGKNLEIIDFVSTEGHIPRDFSFNKSEDYLIVAHQESDNLTLFKRDSTSGKLELLQKDFTCPEGTCVYPI